MTEQQFVEVNGEKITLEQFNEMKKDPNIHFTEVSPGVYRKLEKMNG